MKITVVGILCLVAGAIVFVTAPLFGYLFPAPSESEMGTTESIDSVYTGKAAPSEKEPEWSEDDAGDWVESEITICGPPSIHIDFDVEFRNRIIGVVLMVLGTVLTGLNARQRQSPVQTKFPPSA